MRIAAYEVTPRLPARLEALRELAHNLLWSWDEELRALFVRVDADLWRSSYQNPVRMLGSVAQERLDALAVDEGFLALFDRVVARYRAYLSERTWWDQRYEDSPRVAYFSAEFGLTECLPIYSGGLGVLAGHHLKSASDLGVPVVGVGLLYQQGYFRQYLTGDGWQQESYPVNDFYNLPVVTVVDDGGAPLRVVLDIGGRPALVQVWKAIVGRVTLVLLDTNLADNPADIRAITDQLYGGDNETRFRQEMVLGIGGVRALDAMGLRPVVCHMNEGHSAFQSLERIRLLMRESGLTFAEALEATRAGAVFTTHTPVPAGFDVFPAELVTRLLGPFAADAGIPMADILELGATGPGAGGGGAFNMALLALRTSSSANGVSELHGQVSRELLGKSFPEIPAPEIPVSHVTNGVHTRSVVSREMAQLFDRYLGPEWWRHPGQAATWKGVADIPDEELWATHERRRQRLVAFGRQRLVAQVAARGGTARDIDRAKGVLDARALTIGFARRFATYKRADLLLRDSERLERILRDAERPVQIIFAGKAHPRDHEGKDVLKTIARFCQREDVRRHAVFLEDYDLVMSRYLVQGVDVWLNTPRRGMEASGTSGMKVLPNGGLNVSILDGWWCEGNGPDVGWAIGKGEAYDDHAHQDYVESNALYDLLEKEVVPLFYARQQDAMPRAWIERMKSSMGKLSPIFSTNRMIWEYGERFYLPAARRVGTLMEDGAKRARELAAWRTRVTSHWGEVGFETVESTGPEALRVGDGHDVEAVVGLGKLRVDDVRVEISYGTLSAQGVLIDPRLVTMARAGAVPGTARHRYRGRIPCDRSGRQGFAVRVRPFHADAASVLDVALMTWW